MKFSYNWIRELVEGLDLQPKALEHLITIKTAECEGVEELGAPLAKAAEAVVVSVEPMGQSHNRKTVVETRGTRRQVVCGAPNCRAGMRAVHLDIGKKTIEGVESDGMLASEAELGIGSDHKGIVELDGPFSLAPDFAIEVDNKSLTHRPDLWGHHGMAREVAAITGKHLLDPVPHREFPGTAAIEVTVEDYNLCPRYSALVFENVTVRPSPLWLLWRLKAIGLNSISNVVDVTNYVMALISQPMHAFDSAKLRGGIIVRRARDGERIAALNDQTYDLDSSNLVIADPGGAIALAGVIGGAESAISESTNRIVLESANFNASSVRKTSTRIRLRTDASMRFEKSQDPLSTVRGLQLAAALLEEVSPGIRLVGGMADAYRPAPAPPPIELPLDWLDRKLGKAVPASEVRRILESLEFVVTESEPRAFTVSVPSWRATKDVSIKEDLVEEIGRMIGYETIPLEAPLAPAKIAPQDPHREFHHHVRKLAAAQGYTEVFNYSFVSEDTVREFGLDRARHVEVANPIAAGQDLLRTSLLPGIRRNIATNARNFDSFRLFEIGREIYPDHESTHLTAAIFAKEGDGAAGLMELKRFAECLLPGASTRPAEARSYEHPQRAAEVLHGYAVVGRLFEFHPSMVETGRAAVLDLDLAAVESLQPKTMRYHPLRRFPTSAFDLTVVVPARTLIAEVQSALPRGDEVIDIEYLREFALPDGGRSLSYRITVGATDRTLSSGEVNAVRASMIAALTTRGYELKT